MLDYYIYVQEVESEREISTASEQKEKEIKDDDADIEFFKIGIRTPRRRKSQLMESGKVKFTKLDEEI